MSAHQNLLFSPNILLTLSSLFHAGYPQQFGEPRSMLLFNFKFWQKIQISGLKCMGVGCLTALSLLSLPNLSYAFSWQQELTSDQTTLNFKLDNPYQIEQIRRPKSTEIYIPLKTPCGSLQHLWATKEPEALLKAVRLEYDAVTIKHASFVDLQVLRPKPDLLIIKFSKKPTKKEQIQDENRKTRRLQAAANSGRVDIHTTRALLLPDKGNQLVASEVDLQPHDPFLAQLKLELAAINADDPNFSEHVETVAAENLLVASDFRRSLHGLHRLPYSAMQEHLAKALTETKHLAQSLEPKSLQDESLNVADAANPEFTTSVNHAQADYRAPAQDNGPKPTPYSQTQGASGPKPWSSFGAEDNSRRSGQNTFNSGRQPGNNISSSDWRSSMDQAEQARPQDRPAFEDEGISHGHTIPGELDPDIAKGHSIPGVATEQPTTPQPAPNKRPSSQGQIFEHRQPISTEVRSARSTDDFDEPPAKPQSQIRQEVKPVQNTPKPLPAPKVEPKPQPQVQAKPEPKPQPKANVQPKPQAQPAPQSPAPKKNGEIVHGQADLTPEGLVPEKKEEEEKPEVERPTIYVDEKGNPVEKPLDIKAMLKDAEQLLEAKQNDDALIILNKLREAPDIDQESLEKTLYYISDATWSRYEKDLLAGYDDITAATNQALNFNVRSPRVPDALLRLVLINCIIGNVEEGRAYVAAMLRRYPNYPGNAVGLVAVGKEELKKHLYPEAEKSFTTVLDKYPESSNLRDASVGLIKACVEQKKFDRAKLILEFANKRWPRYYVDDPDFLLVQSDVEKHFGQTEPMLQSIWQLVNLLPDHPKAASLFLNVADVYMRAKNNAAADFLYDHILKIAPDSSEAITAKLRLAEKGIYESPLKPEQMYLRFGQGSKPPFWKLYDDIASASKTYPDSVLSRVKLALWYLWDKQYIEAMGKAADFIDNYPENPEKPLADEIIWKSFQAELKTSLGEQNYGRILVLWNGFPTVRKRYGEPDPKLRYALAQGEKERGNEEGAMQMLRYFLRSPMDPEYGEIAFLDFFNKYLREGNWNALLDLGKTVANWDLKPNLRYDLDYAMALSAQNLSLKSTALKLWKKISANESCPLYQRAWAMVFLAQDAERKKDIRLSYDYNKQVVDMFTALQDERSDKADPERIKNAMNSLMDICEVANKVPEALQWVNRYRTYIKQQSPEYPALRFREARLYRKLGDANRAQALLEEIIRYYPNSPYAAAAKSEVNTFSISRDLQNFQNQEATPRN